MVRKRKRFYLQLWKSAPDTSARSARHRPDRAVADSGGLFQRLSITQH